MEFEVYLSIFFLLLVVTHYTLLKKETCKLCPATFNSGMIFIVRVVSMTGESRVKNPFNCNINCNFLRKQKKSGKHVICVTYVVQHKKLKIDWCII